MDEDFLSEIDYQSKVKEILKERIFFRNAEKEEREGEEDGQKDSDI